MHCLCSSTRIPSLADGEGAIMRGLAGRRGDSPWFEAVLDKVRMSRLGPGRPRVRPDRVRADKAYASRRNRAYPRRCGIRCTILDKTDQARNRRRPGSRGGRPPRFDREACKRRNTVERCINKLKQWRGLATRYDKTATIYLAGLHLAAIFIWSAR